MKKTARIGILMVLLAFAVTACATGGTPLPQTLKIEQPGPDTPKEIADYIGVWEGVWDLEIYGIRSFRAMTVTIVIEKIKDSRVTAIYSWGNWRTYINEGWIRMTGVVENGKILLRSGSRNITLDKDPGNTKTLNAIYSSGNWRGDAVLFKRDSKNINTASVKRDISHLPEKIRAYNGTWRGYFSNGTPITEDIQVISEKKVIVTHMWEDNPSRPNIKAGSWTIETEFKFNDKSETYISCNNPRNTRNLILEMNKDGSLSVGLKSIDGEWRDWGDLKKVE